MTMEAERIDQPTNDPVSNVLKWILLVVAVASFAILGWTTKLTYEAAPPLPDRLVTADGAVLMSAADIVSGKAGFQKADLMDYGSLYGMGSYFGEDYTAANLVRLATLTEANIAKARTGKALSDLATDEQAAVKAAMQAELQGVDLTKPVAVIPDHLAAAIATLRGEIVQSLLHHDFAKGWTQAYSLDQRSAEQTADFLIYSSLTTVARRPDVPWSWTQNWPFEPLVGNTPTTSTFRWTWISFCFAFFAFGAVLFIYQRFLNDPDQAPMDPVLARFLPLTASQRRVGKYFLVVAGVLLLQILAGSIMAHYYTDRASFYGVAVRVVVGHERTDENLQQQHPGHDEKVLADPPLARGQWAKAGKDWVHGRLVRIVQKPLIDEQHGAEGEEREAEAYPGPTEGAGRRRIADQRLKRPILRPGPSNARSPRNGRQRRVDEEVCSLLRTSLVETISLSPALGEIVME